MIRAGLVVLTLCLPSQAVAQSALQDEEARQARLQLLQAEMDRSRERIRALDQRIAFLLATEHVVATIDTAIIAPVSGLILARMGVPESIAYNYYPAVRGVTDVLLGQQTWSEFIIDLGISNLLDERKPGLGYFWDNGRVQYEYGQEWIEIIDVSHPQIRSTLDSLRSTLDAFSDFYRPVVCSEVSSFAVMVARNSSDFSIMVSQNSAEFSTMTSADSRDFREMTDQNSSEFAQMTRLNSEEYRSMIAANSADYTRLVLQGSRGIYDSQVRTRRMTYDASVEARRRVYDMSVNSRRTIYDERVEERRRIYNEAVADRRGLYDEHVQRRRECLDSRVR